MTDKKTHRETMWAEMKPDIYGDPAVDQIVALWSCHAAGDHGGADTRHDVSLAARTFPPGTKVTISEPLCPQCGELREPKFPIPERGPLFGGACECGFDWDQWVTDQYA